MMAKSKLCCANHSVVEARNLLLRGLANLKMNAHPKLQTALAL